MTTKRLQYSMENLKKAIAAVQNKLSIRQAGKPKISPQSIDFNTI